MELFNTLMISFSFYAFLGWTMETLYATQKHHEFVNRGFLHGPFCPIYGLGGLLVEQTFATLARFSGSTVTTALGGVLGSIVLVTILEYATGSVLENVFHKKWWDYSHEPFNLHGYICLKFSVLWGFVAYGFMQVIQPIHRQAAALLSAENAEMLAMALVAYFAVDLTKTVTDLVDLRRVVTRYADYSIDSYVEKIVAHKRIFRAFPSLRQLNAQVKNREIRRIFDEKCTAIKSELKRKRS